ncbi:hypothetical protein Olsu_0447 [Olsenella uli DSM 7084]|uniref:Uncharacterized protein n=1 Tax=Olsenella uli (strain ATCC 49627 / DSM 7084 / CCUG 31166 / CIP 109912 / JCM 12494 / LMG 11480 / NCIMB 702895 / VPI D76D-27C) TaxID=633147 RepID=E1QYV4_OLSUV|nr:hypothetical protein [Olsenella uli]ADK67568.1 hypothetical protein Olsu_0447 [Olsenella uli DSM 7084]KRO13647.1 hypothetical protein IV77_GL001109 [Olsenella uli DSM 7084]
MDELPPVDERIAEQMDILRELRHYYLHLHHAGLHPLDPDEYYERQIDRRAYREPRDKSRSQARKDAGVSLLLRVHALLSETAKAELEQRKTLADIKEQEYTAEHARMVEEDRAVYLKQQEQCNLQIDERRRAYLDGDPLEVMGYFETVLHNDSFTLEFPDRPQPYESCVQVVSYDQAKKTLFVRYRAPNADEICTIDSFTFNEKEWMVETKELPAQNSLRVRASVLHAIIVRTAALVFYSDAFHLVDSLTITGYLDYFDPAYGTNQTIDVLKTTVSEEEFLKVDLERARLEDLFTRLFKSHVASGLYKKKPYELKGVT